MAAANNGETFLTLNNRQIKTLHRHSVYFQALHRSKFGIDTSDDLQGLPDGHIDIQIPLCRHHTIEHFSPLELRATIFCLAQSEHCTMSIPTNLSPLQLYHIGLFLQSAFLLHLALNLSTPLYAADFILGLLHIYSSPGFIHPHITYLLGLIRHYTHMSIDDILSLAQNPLNRALRDRVRGELRTGHALSRFFCLICGNQCPNIILHCCRYAVHFHCFQERMQVLGSYTCPNGHCNHKYELFYNGLMRQQDYIPVRLTPQHAQPPNPQYPNPSTEMFDYLVQHFPKIMETVKKYRALADRNLAAFLQALNGAPPPAIGRPG